MDRRGDKLIRIATLSLSTTAVAGAFLVMVTLPAKDASAASGEGITVGGAPGASLEIHGTSTLHGYSAKAQKFDISLGLDAGRVAAAGQRPDLETLIREHFVKTLQVTVLVDMLASGDQGLDTNLRKALKASQYKQIRFQMDSYDVLPPSLAGNAFTVNLHGRLRLAGVERKIDVGAAGARVSDGIRFTGSSDLLMTDYQIKPPTVMFGAIKAANLVTVTFSATLRTR